MATGTIQSITGSVTYSDVLELTIGDDTLNVTNAMLTLALPAGDMELMQGDDILNVTDSTITGATGVAIKLGSGMDTVSLSNSTIQSSIRLGSGNDYVLITGTAQSIVTLNALDPDQTSIDTSEDLTTLSLGSNDDVLELCAILQGNGVINFGTGSDTLKFNGGTLSTTGGMANLNNLYVTTAGGTTNRDIVLYGADNVITWNGNLTGNHMISIGEVQGVEKAAVTIHVDNNSSSNMGFSIEKRTVTQLGDANWELTSRGFTANDSTVSLQNLVLTNTATGLQGTNTDWSIKDSTIGKSSTNGVTLTNGNIVLSNVSVNQNSKSGAVITGSDLTFDKVSFNNNGENGVILTGEHLTFDKVSFNNNTENGAIITGGNLTFNEVSFDGNSSYGLKLSSASLEGNMTCQQNRVGGVYIEQGNVTGQIVAVSNSGLSINRGGGIYISKGSVSASMAYINGNAINSILLSSFSSSIGSYEDRVILSASCYGEGAGIYVQDSELFLESGCICCNYIPHNYTSTYIIRYNILYHTSCFLAKYYIENCNEAKGGGFYAASANINLTNVSLHSNTAGRGAAFYAKDSIVNLLDVDIKNNIGGYAVELEGNTQMTLSVSANLQQEVVGNSSGFLKLSNTSQATFTINDGALLTITDSISNGTHIAKNGAGTLTITAGIDGNGSWNLVEGLTQLLSVARSINLNSWTIGTNAMLQLSECNDTVSLSADKKTGTLDFGGDAGGDILNLNGYCLSGGLLMISALTINGGGGSVSSEITNRIADDAFNLTLSNVTLESRITGGNSNDSITITADSTIASDMDLGGGNNTLSATDMTVSGSLAMKNGKDTIKATGTATFNKKVDIGKGNDTLSFNNVTFNDELTGDTASTQTKTFTITGTGVFNGKVTFSASGYGASVCTFNTVSFKEDVYLGGKNSIAINDSATFFGRLDLGRDDDVITAVNALTLKGALNADAGNDAITVNGVGTFSSTVDLGEGNDTISIGSSGTFSGAIDLGEGNDTISIDGSGTFSGITELGSGDDSITVGNILTVEKGLNAGDGNDTITMSSTTATSLLKGLVDMGTGSNKILLKGKLGGDKKFRLVDDGSTTLTVYRGAEVLGNTLSVMSSETSTLKALELDWSEIEDLDKVRILISKDASFQTYEFSVELYNRVTNFTINMEDGYYYQFQSNDEDGWAIRYLSDVEAPDQVTGLTTEGRDGVTYAVWTATHDNWGGNGVSQYRVQVATDGSFANIVKNELTTTNELALGDLDDGNYHYRVQAIDYTGNEGEWSESKTMAVDSNGPTAPSGLKATVSRDTVSLDWNDSTDAGSGVSHYIVTYATDSQFADATTRQVTASELKELTLEDGVYYWKVKAVDQLGNASQEVTGESFAVDTVAPTAPVASANATNPTNQPVVVSATFSGDTATRQYSLDGSDWKPYLGGISMSDNGTVHFRGIDAAGNISDVTSYTVTNIDKIAPDAPTAYADVTTLTRQDVTVSATFSADSATRQYSLDNAAWKPYTTGIAMSENGSVYFRGIDEAGNISEAVRYDVKNIDKTLPTITNITANTTEATNQSVTVTASFADNVALKERQYKIGAGSWLDYTNGVTVSQNATIAFKAVDSVGNEATASYDVTNIDKEKPTITNVAASTTQPTNQSVMVTASFADNVALKSREYKIGNGGWQDYVNGAVMTENGTVTFRAIDTAGNMETSSLTVANIDTTAPVIELMGDTTSPLQKSSITATTEAGLDIYYSQNNQSWAKYTGKLDVTTNGIWYFKSTDAAGNTGTAEITFANIDTAAPVIELIGDTTSPLQKSSLTATTEAGLDIYYSQDNQAWTKYTDKLNITTNGTWYFKATDAAGNVGTNSIEFKNIDTVAPVIELVGDTTTLLQKSSITATTENGLDIFYSQDNQSWTKYTGKLNITTNGTWYFKATDAAGNIGTNSIEFKNIDTVAPVIELVGDTTTPLQKASITASTEASLDIYYSQDNKNWNKYTGKLNVTENGTWYFKATDAAGNIGTNSIVFRNIDTVAPVIELTGDTTSPLQKSSITATTEAGLDIYYSQDSQAWTKYTGKLNVTVNGTWYFKSTDAAGNTGTAEITFANIDTTAPTIDLIGDTTTILQKSSITASTEAGRDIYYSQDNQSWTKYTGKIDVTANGTWYFKATDAAGNTGTAEITFANIDTTAPVIELTGDTTSPLQKSSITASTEAGLDIFYSQDNKNWNKYTGKLNVTENGTWYFKATDAAGNIGTNSIEFRNIDTVAPVIELTGDTTSSLQQSSIIASTEVGLAIYYSQDNQSWTEYMGKLDVTTNGIWYFKATDAAGNVGTNSIEFKNIDTVAPVIELVGDTTTLLQKSSITATTEADLDIFYSTDNQTWTKYTGKLNVTVNGTWYFKATDTAGNTGTAEITFANIDSTAPVIQLTGDTTSPLQKSSITASTEAGLDIFYSTDNQTWTKYTGKLNVTENGIWYFKAMDAAGNVGTNSIEFKNIDTAAPVIELVGDTTTPLQKSTITATTEDGLDIYYSRDNQTWTKYPGALEVNANGTWHFKATDAAGNTGTAEITFANIDTTAPTIDLTGDTTTILQKSSITATTETGLDIYYSQDNKNWNKYTGKLDVTTNGTWYFKATDAAGNTGNADITFANIDTTAPVIKLVGDNVTPLKQTTLSASTEAGVTILYSSDGKFWGAYDGTIAITTNGTWYFKATDAVGNTGTAEITFANIDSTAPVIKLVGDNVTPLKQTTLSASTEVGITILYSSDGKFWGEYDGTIAITTNGTWYFRATDAAGNTGTAEITFANIDTVAPVIQLTGDTTTPLQKSSITASTEVGLGIYYSQDNQTWTKYTGRLDITTNGIWYFKATDAAGNVGTNAIEFRNIDTTAPVIELTGDTTSSLQQSSITASTEAGLDIYYSQDNQSWTKYTGKLDITTNGTWYFKATDAAGNIGTNAIEFKNIDTAAPVIELVGDTTTPLQKSTITATTEDGLEIYYSQDNQSWEKYTDKLNITTNGTWYFKATDAAGNVGTNSIEFKNIDTAAPVIKLVGDTSTVLQKSSITATTEAGLDIYYSQDNQSWTKYTGKLDVTTNGTWYFKATDAAGNVGSNSIEFKNIDTAAPVIELFGDTTTPLQKSSITASTEAGLDIYYSQDNKTWTKYTSRLDVTENGTWYFKATDAVGNVGKNSIAFKNIDTTAPAIKLTGDTTTPLQKATITATTESGVDIYYSQDNKNWNKYTGKLDVTVNGTWYFKSTDAAGNTGTADITFANIDTTAPVIQLTGDTTSPLQKSSITASTEMGLDIFYSTDNQSWTKYTGKLDITTNGTWYFKTTDAAGNTGKAEITFANIDTAAPVIELVGDTTSPLQKSTITATTESGVDIYYSQDNKNWTKYTGKLEVTENGTWYFKATDATGNVGTNSIVFRNIDTVAPVIELTGDTTTLLQKSSITATTEAGLDIYYSQDYKNWNKYTGKLDVTANGTWYFKATDAAGNIGTNTIVFRNIDSVAPVLKLTGDTTSPLQKSSITATTEAGLAIFYSTDNQTWTKYTGKLNVTENGIWYFKATDAAGNVGTNSIEFKNIDTAAPVIELVGDTTTPLQKSTITATTEAGLDIYYSRDFQTWTKYPGALEVNTNGTWHFKATDAAGNTGTAEITFANIDTTAPTLDLLGDTTTILQKSSITATTEAGLDIYYSQDNQSWTKYTGKLDVTENGTWYFKATDAAGNTGTADITFVNIDSTAPVIKLVGDNVTPLKQTTLSASTEAGVTILYSSDGKFWGEYDGTIAITTNGTWYFKATDAVGNTGTAEITFANIDSTVPVIKLVGDNVTPLKQTTLSASTEAGVTILYSSDGKFWGEYDGTIAITTNGTWYFKATDAAGNTGTAEITFANIDSIAPAIQLTGDTTSPLQKSSITATTESGVDIYYSQDNQTWTKYTGRLDITTNGTWYFKATDAAGNVGTNAIEFRNIDTTAPVIELTGDTTSSLQQSSITASTEAGLDIYYSQDNQSWTKYTGKLDITTNGTWYFKATDAAGNVGTNSIEFKNIDTAAPVIELAGDTTTPLQKSSITATTEDGLDIYYSQDNKTWTLYTGTLDVTANGTWFFMATDTTGNVGKNSIEFKNIDTTAPVIQLTGDTTSPLQKSSITASTEAGLDILYSTDNQTWTKYTGTLDVTTNGTWYFKVTDAAGNTGTADITFANIDSIAPVIQLTGDTTSPLQKSSITASTEAGLDIIYSTDNQTWTKYIGKLDVTVNGTWYFKATDAAGNIGTNSIEFKNIDTSAPVIELVGDTTTPLQKSSITASTEGGLDIYYSQDNKNWNKYTGTLDVTVNSTWYFKATDAAGNVGLSEITFANIDSIAPVIQLTGDTTTPLQKSSITASTEAGLDIYYSQDNQSWEKYMGAVDVTTNGTWYFKATDAAGNIGTNSIEFKNIDTAAPVIELVGDTTTPLQKSAITATTEDGLEIYYSQDNKNWNKYTGTLDVTVNGTWHFRSMDAAGNVGLSEITFANIDTTAPTLSDVVIGAPDADARVTLSFHCDSDVAQRLYSWNDGSWTAFIGNELTFEQNGRVAIRLIDAAGNETVSQTYEITGFNVQVDGLDQAAVPGTTDALSLSWNKGGSNQWTDMYQVDVAINGQELDLPAIEGEGIELHGLGNAEISWSVTPVQSEISSESSSFSFQGTVQDTPQLVQALDNGVTDAFFARKFATWNEKYQARHVGSVGDWDGTGEKVQLKGKNKITDVFSGSEDTTLMYLTDDANGDALFVDDIYSELPGTLAKQQARISKIDEIRAGAGDDLIDMTSQLFEYVGSGVAIHGGLGNDTIWACKGDNKLFGDAGDDRLVGASGNDVLVGGIGSDSMHGGGGHDIFCFCDNWGQDTVEQLATDDFRIWFEEDLAQEDMVLSSAGNDTLIVKTGTDNTITVKNMSVAEVKSRLIFGADGEYNNLTYSDLSDAGAFSAFSSEKIFEDKNKGALA